MQLKRTGLLSTETTHDRKRYKKKMNVVGLAFLAIIGFAATGSSTPASPAVAAPAYTTHIPSRATQLPTPAQALSNDTYYTDRKANSAPSPFYANSATWRVSAVLRRDIQL